MTGFDKPNYTQVPNVLLDVLMADMTESELKIVLVAVRKIMGYHKDRDAISFSQFEEMSGLSRPAVQDGLNHALEHGWIIKADTGVRNVGIYTLAIREDASLVKNSNQLKNATSSSKKSLPMTGKKSLPTKERGNKTKEKSPKPPKGAVTDDSPESQAVTAIIHAWLTHTQTIEPNAYKNKSKRSDALFMHNNGVTPEIIGAWAKSLRRTDFWRDKAITWKKLTGEILPFKDNYKPVPHIVPERPFEPAPERAKPDEIISEEEKAELRQIFEELVKSKVANG